MYKDAKVYLHPNSSENSKESLLSYFCKFSNMLSITLSSGLSTVNVMYAYIGAPNLFVKNDKKKMPLRIKHMAANYNPKN